MSPREDGCVCQIIGWSRDPYEPHIPAQAEREQADDCPVHPLPATQVQPVTSVELVAAARWLLLLRDDPALSGTIYRGALGMWTELTSASNDTTAVEWAETIAALDTLPAHVTPF